MTLYSVSSIGKSIKHYAVFGFVCVGLGVYLGSCTSCVNNAGKPGTSSMKSDELSAGEGRNNTRNASDIAHAPYFPPSSVGMFEQYTEPPSRYTEPASRADSRQRFDQPYLSRRPLQLAERISR